MKLIRIIVIISEAFNNLFFFAERSFPLREENINWIIMKFSFSHKNCSVGINLRRMENKIKVQGSGKIFIFFS